MARVTYAFVSRHGRFTLALICLCMVGLAWMVRAGYPAGTAGRAGLNQFQSERWEVESLLAQIGIEPTTLATAGFADENISALVASAGDWLDGNGESMRHLSQQLAESSVSVVVIERSLRRGKGEYSLQQLDDARSALAQALSAVIQRQTAFVEAVSAGIGPEQMAVLDRLRGNHVWQLDLPYLAVELDEGHWLSLKNALRCGEQAPPEDQATLANVHSDMDYTLATANLSSRLPEIRTAWEQAWSGQ